MDGGTVHKSNLNRLGKHTLTKKHSVSLVLIQYLSTTPSSGVHSNLPHKEAEYSITNHKSEMAKNETSAELPKRRVCFWLCEIFLCA